MKIIRHKTLLFLVFLFIGINAQAILPNDSKISFLELEMLNDIEIKEDAKGKYFEMKNYDWKGNQTEMIIRKHKALSIVKDMQIEKKVTRIYFDKKESDENIRKFAKTYFNR